MNPLAITGLGAACSLGVGSHAFVFDRLRHVAEQGLERATASTTRATGDHTAPRTSFDASRYPGARIREVPEFDPAQTLGDKGLRTLDRLTKLLLVAARNCLHDANIKSPEGWQSFGPDDVGVVCSNAYGSLEAITELDRVAQLEDARYINPAKFPNTVSNSASGYVSIWEDLRALNMSVSDGTCGSLDAVSCADIALATDRASAVLCGGGEAMSEALFIAFEKLGVFRAFDAVAPLGEGAAFMALEDAASAKARGATMLGHIVGYGTAFASEDANHMFFGSERALERAITLALTDANMHAAEIDLVVSSLSGMPTFDDRELAAVERVQGLRAPIVAPKRIFGETLGAGGALAMAATLAWLNGVPVAADLVARASSGAPENGGSIARGSIRRVLVTTLGFYGNASALVVAAPDLAR